MSIPFTFKPDQYRDDAVHVSVDLETASTADNAAIVQIAAVVVGSNYTHNAFDKRISIASCEAHGCDVSVDTMLWWDVQDKELRKKIFGGTAPLGEMLFELEDWFHEISEGDLERIYLWGNGADFDCTILRNAYEIFKPWPINFRQHEHLRTLKRALPVEWQQFAHDMFMDKFGAEAKPHDALYDAIYQAYIIQHGLEYQKQCKAIMDDLS